jgi:hypothetical protein
MIVRLDQTGLLHAIRRQRAAAMHVIAIQTHAQQRRLYRPVRCARNMHHRLRMTQSHGTIPVSAHAPSRMPAEERNRLSDALAKRCLPRAAGHLGMSIARSFMLKRFQLTLNRYGIPKGLDF